MVPIKYWAFCKIHSGQVNLPANMRLCLADDRCCKPAVSKKTQCIDVNRKSTDT